VKKLINDPASVVLEKLQGLALAHADLLKVHFDPVFVVRAAAPVMDKVGILSGGGSGHEPLHCGFVGVGMLDAACPGAIFTSPTPDQILEATKSIYHDAGVLYLVKNYTGDVLNFEMAAELAAEEGLTVAVELIDDDVSVEKGPATAGRRGVGTTVFAEKICGAAAEAGLNLPAVAALCRKVNGWSRSMGMALTSCTVPHVGKPTFELGAGEMEMGIGIHGEPGRRRVPLAMADEITEMLTLPILNDLPFKPGDAVIAMVNGMGGTPLGELYIVYRKLAEILHKHDITIARTLVGNYITALEMAGTSITLLKTDAELLKLWDAPVKTPALHWGM